MEATYKGIKFSDNDVVNPRDFVPRNDYNPQKVRPFLIHDQGFTVCVVFADCLQDALDEAVDNDKLDSWLIDLDDANTRDDYLIDYGEEDNLVWKDVDGKSYYWKYQPSFLGNASEPFDIETLDVVELTNPSFSFCALYNVEND